jgi:hypothetical protein
VVLKSPLKEKCIKMVKGETVNNKRERAITPNPTDGQKDSTRMNASRMLMGYSGIPAKEKKEHGEVTRL